MKASLDHEQAIPREGQGAHRWMDNDHDDSINNPEDDEDAFMEAETTGDPSTNDDSSQRDEVREVERMAKGETRTVKIWRMVVGIILMGAGALVSWGTYYYLDQQLEDETVDKVITIES